MTQVNKNAKILFLTQWFPDTEFARCQREFPDCTFIDGRDEKQARAAIADADILFGKPGPDLLPLAGKVQWIQLATAGVPRTFCKAIRGRAVRLTNLAGLYGPTIAEHTLAMMLILSRNLHFVQDNQRQKKWDRTVADTMRDLRGNTLAIIGVGDIGVNIARLAKAFGMEVRGNRRTPRSTPFVDRIFGPGDLIPLLTGADYIVVAVPLVNATEGILGDAEFKAIKPGAILINVSRGAIAQESALVDALQSGHLAAAGLDAFATEPLPEESPLWTLPNVLISPHYSGEIVNISAAPTERFTRNLCNWFNGCEMEGVVDADQGY